MMHCFNHLLFLHLIISTNPPNFHCFAHYNQQFCFQFNRQGTHKTLEKDLVVALLKMCLNNDRITSHRLDTFCEFLETTKDESYSKITLDQWRSFLDFSQEFPDEGSLMGYDESESAWPVLIDEYVEFMEKKAKK